MALKSVSVLQDVSGNKYLDTSKISTSNFAVDASGNVTIKSGGVGSTQLASSAVTADKIANGAITAAKLASGVGTYTLPTASSSTLGGIKVGTGLSISSGVLSNAYTLPTASSSTLGGIKVGTGLSISDGVLSVSSSSSYTLPIAASGTLGGVKVGSGAGLSINSSTGVLSAVTASSSALGVIKIGTGLSISSGKVSVSNATTSTLGGIKVGSGLSVSSGVLSIPTASYTSGDCAFGSSEASKYVTASVLDEFGVDITNSIVEDMVPDMLTDYVAKSDTTYKSISDKLTGDNVSTRAAVWTTGKSYAVGNFFYFGSKLYKVTTAHTSTSSDGTSLAAGTFTKGTVVKIDDVVLAGLPVASASTLGGIKVGSGLSISNGVLSATGSSSQNSTGGDGSVSSVTEGDSPTQTSDGCLITVPSTKRIVIIPLPMSATEKKCVINGLGSADGSTLMATDGLYSILSGYSTRNNVVVEFDVLVYPTSTMCFPMFYYRNANQIDFQIIVDGLSSSTGVSGATLFHFINYYNGASRIWKGYKVW